MKKILLIVVIATTSLFTSCMGGCDTSTAEGAANCLCELTDQSVILDQTDEVAAKELSDKIIKTNKEIEKAIDAGNYTAEELKTLASERGCM